MTARLVAAVAVVVRPPLLGLPPVRQQSVEQSSLDVWNNSNSGVNPNAATVSYYDKGQILALLLDAKIRRETFGQKSSTMS